MVETGSASCSRQLDLSVHVRSFAHPAKLMVSMLLSCRTAIHMLWKAAIVSTSLPQNSWKDSIMAYSMRFARLDS